MRSWLRWLILAMFLVLAGVVFVRHSGAWLVRNEPRRSDVMVVLAGDVNDRRYWTGIELLRAGYGRKLLVDASEDEILYGRSLAEHAKDFIAASAGSMSGQVEVCPIRGDSTVLETQFTHECLRRIQPKSVLLVTSDYHTRRAFVIFRTRLPQYSWSSAAASDETQYGVRWWQHREWSKNYLKEYEKLAWWMAIERWRYSKLDSN